MYYTKRPGFYRHELLYKGWRVMIFKAGIPTITLNFLPALNHEEMKKLELSNNSLYLKINSICSKNVYSINMPSPTTPNTDFIVSQAKNYIDHNLGEFDLDVKLKQILP